MKRISFNYVMVRVPRIVYRVSHTKFNVPHIIQKLVLTLCLLASYAVAYCWGFYGHQKINYQAVFALPPQMLVLYKPQIDFLKTHAVDADKRRYAIPQEAPRHYIDIDFYGLYPYDALPRRWSDAATKFSADTLQAHGIVPWHIQTMLARLTQAFKDKDFAHILQYSADLGHYVADAHVPLHASSNHNGQHTNQRGIHAFWESRVPELLAEKEFDIWMGHAEYMANPGAMAWEIVLQSALASDSVLLLERQLNNQFDSDKKYAFEERNGLLVRQYSTAYTIAYNTLLNGMVERRMRQSIQAVANCWFTAWVNAGQPDLQDLANRSFSPAELAEFEQLEQSWLQGHKKGKTCDE